VSGDGTRWGLFAENRENYKFSEFLFDEDKASSFFPLDEILAGFSFFECLE
jgi:hypothetical protein